MAIHRLNHAVLYVADVERSVEFYATQLGFRTISTIPGGAFLRAAESTNDHDLGLFEIGSQPRRDGRSVGLYHLAWEVDTLGDLADLATSLSTAGALVGASDHGTTKSLYAADPDGIEFEVVWLIPSELLTDADRAAATSVRPLDLERELDRFGRTERSGLGVSRPATV